MKYYFNSKKHGFSLMELMVYIGISTLVIGAILTIYFFVQNAYWKSSASFSLQENSYTAVQYLQRDLRQTSLNSITVYPNETNTSEAPGVSFASANLDGPIAVTRYNRPEWNNFVFYTLQDNPYNAQDRYTPRTARLVRHVLPLSGDRVIPLPADGMLDPVKLPSQVNSNDYGPRTVLNSVMKQVRSGDPEMEGFPQLTNDNLKYGGFRVNFVRKKYDKSSGKEVILKELHAENPSALTDSGGKNTDGVYPSATSTELVQTDIIVLQVNEQTGKPNAFSSSFMVNPRN